MHTAVPGQPFDRKKDEVTGAEIQRITGFSGDEIVRAVNELLREGLFTLEVTGPVTRQVTTLDFVILVTKAGKDKYEEIRDYGT
jgi:hypothetical protein